LGNSPAGNYPKRNKLQLYACANPFLSPFITDDMFYRILGTSSEQKHAGLTIGANMKPWILAHALECTPELLALGLILAWVGVTFWLAVLDYLR